MDIEGFVQLPNFVRVFESSWHFNIQVIVQVLVGKSRSDVRLLDFQSSRAAIANSASLGHKFDDYGEGFIEVDLIALFETTDDPACFVALNLPSRAFLQPVDSFPT